jgi:hypothetical protein
MRLFRGRLRCVGEEPEEEELLASLRRLDPLLGSWGGSGTGRYPTIDAFAYREELRFELHAEYPMLAYEQKTVLDTGAASHWETGFVRPVGDGVYELSNAQDSGRVEVLRGGAELEAAGLELRLESVCLGHDPRLVQTRRILRVEGDRLGYEKHMATNTTDEPVLQLHLQAELLRRD